MFKIKNLLFDKERLQIIIFLGGYLLFYTLFFLLLEQRVSKINVIITEFDKIIPFCEYFIIPYLFWFVFLIGTAIYFLFFCKDLKEVKALFYSFISGMTLFLVVSYFFPNGHTLRPVLEGENLLEKMVIILYKIDTSTNIFPSMHVFCTIAMSIALLRQQELANKILFKPAIYIISCLIILATLFLKQHSIIDIIGAILLNVICYFIFYKRRDICKMLLEK